MLQLRSKRRSMARLRLAQGATPLRRIGEGNLANGPLGALVVWNDDEIARAPGSATTPTRHGDRHLCPPGVVTHETAWATRPHRGGRRPGDERRKRISHSEHNHGEDPSSCSRSGCFLAVAAAHRVGTAAASQGGSSGTTDALASGSPTDTSLQIRATHGSWRDSSCRNLGHARAGPVPACLFVPPGVILVNGQRIAAGDGSRHRRGRTHHHGREDAEFLLVSAADSTAARANS